MESESSSEWVYIVAALLVLGGILFGLAGLWINAYDPISERTGLAIGITAGVMIVAGMVIGIVQADIDDGR